MDSFEVLVLFVLMNFLLFTCHVDNVRHLIQTNKSSLDHKNSSGSFWLFCFLFLNSIAALTEYAVVVG